MSFFMQQLQMQYRKLSEEISGYKEKLNQIRAEGVLFAAKNGKHTQWFKTVNGKREYIKKENVEEAKQLATRKFLERKIKELTEEKQALEDYIRTVKSLSCTSENLLAPDSPYYELIDSAYTEEAAYLTNWDNQPFQTNLDFPENLIHKTQAGIYVRSKSERDICNALFRNNLLFHYEEQLVIENKIYYPDFTIIHPEKHKLIYWEHAGLMDDVNYANRMAKKVSHYAQAGIVLGANLIVTIETKQQPLNISTIEKMIAANFFLS